jgi:O-antigen ligase
MRHANLLLAAVCTGVFIQNSAQIIKWTINPESTNGGLDHHPGFTGLWFIFCIGILLTNSSRSKRRRLALQASVVLPVIGIILTAARSVLLGGAFAIACLAVAKIVRRPGWKSISALLVLIMGAVLYGVTAPESIMAQRINDAFSGFESRRHATLDDIPSVEETRYLWWEIGLDHFRDAWLLGDGLGSAEVSINNDPRITVPTKGGVENTYLLRDDYHSSFVTSAAESGIVGITLFVTWLILLACQLPNGKRISAALAIAFIGYLVFSVFNTAIFSGRVLCLPMVLMALSINPLPSTRSYEEAVRVPEKE